MYLKFPVFLNLSPSRYLIAVIFFINILYTSQMVTNRAACSCFKCSLSLIYAFHPYLVYLTHAKRRHFSSTLAITNRACFSLSAFFLLHLYHINLYVLIPVTRRQQALILRHYAQENNQRSCRSLTNKQKQSKRKKT